MTNEKHKEQSGRQLDVHRKVPGSRYSVEGCVTLCRRCHTREPKRHPVAVFFDQLIHFLHAIDLAPPTIEAIKEMTPHLNRLSPGELAETCRILIEESLERRGLLPPRVELGQVRPGQEFRFPDWPPGVWRLARGREVYGTGEPGKICVITASVPRRRRHQRRHRGCWEDQHSKVEIMSLLVAGRQRSGPSWPAALT
jgi:hypothetical protein